MKVIRHTLSVAVVCISAASAWPGLAANKTEVATEHLGRQLLGRLVTRDKDIAPKQVVLMVHGTFAHKDMELMRALQQGLLERSVASLAITLSLSQTRRKGAFDCKKLITHRHDDAIGEIRTWINWLQKRGAQSVILLGHSRGGAQVALYLARHQQSHKISHAVLLAPMAVTPADEQRSYFRRHKTKLSDIVAQAARLKPYDTMSAPAISHCVPARATSSAILSYYGPKISRDAPGLLRKVSETKVLVIAAGADKVVKNLPKHMAPVAQKPNITLKTVAEAGHMFLDFFADDASELTANFIKN